MNNKIARRIIATLGALACSLCLVAVPETTVPVQAAAATEESISPCAEILEWIYAEINGKIYKRLYNCTTQQWAGDWIYVCEAD